MLYLHSYTTSESKTKMSICPFPDEVRFYYLIKMEFIKFSYEKYVIFCLYLENDLSTDT